MLEKWLLLPQWAMFAVLAGGFVASGGLLFAISYNPWTRERVRGYIGVVPPYVNVLAVLLALLTGFVASETWERQKHARQVVQAETDNVLAVYDISIASPANMSKVREALRNYVKAVLETEWPRMVDGERSKETGDALAKLMIRVSLPQIGTDAGATVQTALLNAVLRIRSARGERLSINEHDIDHSKWLALLILGFLTQCAIGVVHLEKARAHVASLAIFTAGLVSTLGLVAQHQWPFTGATAIQPTALVAANKRIWEGGIEIVGPRPADEAEPDWKKKVKPQAGGAPAGATQGGAGAGAAAAPGAATANTAQQTAPEQPKGSPQK